MVKIRLILSAIHDQKREREREREREKERERKRARDAWVLPATNLRSGGCMPGLHMRSFFLRKRKKKEMRSLLICGDSRQSTRRPRVRTT